MKESLTDRMRTIELIPGWIGIDKDKSLKELLEKERKKIELLDSVMKKENLITREYQEVLTFFSRENFLPIYLNADEQKRILELEKIVGYMGLTDNFSNVVINPAVLGGGGLVMSAGKCLTERKNLMSDKMTRRQSMKKLKNYFIYGSLFLVVPGFVASVAKSKLQDSAEKNALHVQSIIDRLYAHEHNPSKGSIDYT